MYIFIFVIFLLLFIYLSHPPFYFLLKSSCDGYPPLQDSPLVDVDVDNNSITSRFSRTELQGSNSSSSHESMVSKQKSVSII